MTDKPETYIGLIKMMRKTVVVKGNAYKGDSDFFEIAKLKDRTQGLLFHPTYKIMVQHTDQDKQIYIMKKNDETIIRLIRYLKEDEENAVEERVLRDDGTEILQKLWSQHMEGHSID